MNFILEREDYDKCKRPGMWRQSADSVWGDFEADVIYATSGVQLNGLEWSDELSLTAAWHVEDLAGCNVWEPTVVKTTNPSNYLSQIAHFGLHQRFVFYPERMQWRDTKEMVWDLFVDDTHSSFKRARHLLSEEYDSIGVACNCHPTFEVFCVVEIASDIKPRMMADNMNIDLNDVHIDVFEPF